jgi:uncharacterized protein (TIGR03083 family)
MEHKEYLEGIASEIGTMALTVNGSDLFTPVPGCPGWDLSELLRHSGRVHRWVTAMVAARAQEYMNWKTLDLGLPEDDSDLPAWLADGAEPLLAELSADPAISVWSFGPGKCIGWWARRLLQETTVHRTDAELALGLVPVVSPAVAADGIEELLEDLLPYTGAVAKLVALDRIGDSLHLHATDAPGEWTITLTDIGFKWEVGHGKATVAVRGPLTDLLLLMWNRRRLTDSRFELFGDATLMDSWLKATAL